MLGNMLSIGLNVNVFSRRLFKNKLLSGRLLENNVLNLVFKNAALKIFLFKSMIDEATEVAR